ncbi:MAG: type II toxin-antitoxin system VapC family toxin [Nitrospira defluvii]|nr:type II toxin-antitoxin system VapC family toxin [Nitrospira defluvii]
MFWNCFPAFPIEGIEISIVTLTELCYGVAKSRHHSRNCTALEQFVAPLVVADFDRETVRVYGWFRASLEEKGTLE